VWGEQKHPNPDQMRTKLTTKEFFDQEVGSDPLKMMKKLPIYVYTKKAQFYL
jgi:hypothetical protein